MRVRFGQKFTLGKVSVRSARDIAVSKVEKSPPAIALGCFVAQYTETLHAALSGDHRYFISSPPSAAGGMGEVYKYRETRLARVERRSR